MLINISRVNKRANKIWGLETYRIIFEFIWEHVTWLNKVIIILLFIYQIKNFLVFHGRFGGTYFVFTVLSFELTWVPLTVTKVMRCLLKHWRINAIRIACFLDDGLGVPNSDKMTLFHSDLWKISTKRRFYYKRGKICLETI